MNGQVPFCSRNQDPSCGSDLVHPEEVLGAVSNCLRSSLENSDPWAFHTRYLVQSKLAPLCLPPLPCTQKVTLPNVTVVCAVSLFMI